MTDPRIHTVAAAQRRLLEAAAAVGASLPPEFDHDRVRRVAAEALAVGDELSSSGHYDLAVLVHEAGQLIIAAYGERSGNREVAL